MPIIKVRLRLTCPPDELAEDPGAIAGTRRGKPALAILPWELYESIVVTLELLSGDDLMAATRGFNRRM